MRIVVALASYRNPSGLLATIKNLHMLAEHPKNLSFRIGLDEGDFNNMLALRYLPPDIRYDVTYFPLDIPHSDMWNRLCIPGEADFYVLYGDDIVCISPCWDTILERKSKNKLLIFWNDVGNPGAAGAFIVSDAWLRACGYALPIYFPYWFGDTWMDELRAFVTGAERGIDEAMRLYIPKGKTTGMQELDFWWGFFNATRPLRIVEAERIYIATCPLETALTQEEFQTRAQEMSLIMRQRDREHRPQIPELEGAFAEMGDKKAARHARCKKAAIELMQTHKLELWGDI